MNSKSRNERVGTALLDAANREYEYDANLTDVAGRGRGREEGYGWCRVGASPGRHWRSAQWGNESREDRAEPLRCPTSAGVHCPVIPL